MCRQILMLFLVGLSIPIQAQLNMSLIAQYDYPFNTNDVWGYVADNGDEYALVGTRRGLSIVNLETEPLEEVAFIEGSNSTWRDIKTWGNFAYVSTEAADGLLVADLSNVQDTVPFYFWKPAIESPAQPGLLDTLLTIHNLFVDEFGILQITGSNLNNGGVIFVDVAKDPWQPEILALGPPVYSHDSYARDSIVYSSEIYRGTLSIYDYSDLSEIRLLGEQQTPFVFTHNAWLSDDSRYVFTTDERGNAPVTSYDISDLNDIRELDRYIPAETAGQGVVPHNVHVWNDWLVISYYADGGKIVDASRPDNLVEVGSFDTFFSGDPGFGAWGAYPFLPSERVLVTDSGNGLFVLQPNYVRAAFLEGKVEGRINAGREDEEIIPLVNAEITILTDEPVLPVNSKAGGTFKTGKAIPGKFLVEISAEGFITWQDSVDFSNGVVTELNVVLEESTTTSTRDQLFPDEEVSVSPNPASSFIQLDLSNTKRVIKRIEAFDLAGRRMLSRQVNLVGGVMTIPTTTWESSLYLLLLTDDQGNRAVKKIRVQQ